MGLIVSFSKNFTLTTMENELEKRMLKDMQPVSDYYTILSEKN